MIRINIVVLGLVAVLSACATSPNNSQPIVNSDGFPDLSDVVVKLYASEKNPHRSSVLQELKVMGVQATIHSRRECDFKFCKGNAIYFNRGSDYEIARVIRKQFLDEFEIDLVPRTGFENELMFEIDYALYPCPSTNR